MAFLSPEDIADHEQSRIDQYRRKVSTSLQHVQPTTLLCDCGETIDPRRRQANPNATTCITCAREREAMVNRQLQR